MSETYKNTKKIWDMFSKHELLCPDISEENDIELFGNPNTLNFGGMVF